MFRFLLRRLSSSSCGSKSKPPPPKKELRCKPAPTPRPPKDPPEPYDPCEVGHSDIDVDDFVRPAVYRQFSDPCEQLGPGAGSSKPYKNAQYFGHHRFSYVELQSQSVALRDERRSSGGALASNQTGAAQSDDDEPADDCLESMKQRDKENDAKLAVQKKNAELEKLAKWCKEVQNTQNKEEEKAKSVEKEVTNILQECAGKLKKAVDLVEKVCDKPVKSDNSAKCDKPVKTDKPVKCDKPVKSEKSDKPDKPDKPDCDKKKK